MGSGASESREETTMKTLIAFSLAFVGILGAPESKFSCSECVAEMHNLGRLIHEAGPTIEQYLADNYCPTLDDDHHGTCQTDLTHGYLMMLGAIVNHFFVDGAVHICQTMGVCDAWGRRFTCEECVQGLEWVEAYMEDPIQVAEYTLYLAQNFCTSDHPLCPDIIAEHFPPMHYMAMEKFMIPQDICNSQPVCTGQDSPMI